MSLLTPHAPQVLSTRILAMKASLCKLSPCTVTRVCDYHAKLFLIAVSSMLKSLLRPHILNTPDKSPGDRLTEICTKITDVGGSCPQPSLSTGCLLCARHGHLKEVDVPALRGSEQQVIGAWEPFSCLKAWEWEELRGAQHRWAQGAVGSS